MEFEPLIFSSFRSIIFLARGNLLGFDMGDEGAAALGGSDHHETRGLAVTDRGRAGSLRDQLAEHRFGQRIAAKRADITPPGQQIGELRAKGIVEIGRRSHVSPAIRASAAISRCRSRALANSSSASSTRTA